MKILLLDIETSPNTAHVWGLWQQNVSINQLMESSYVLCYAAKWLNEDDMFFDSVQKSKPKAMLKGIHGLLNEADAVVHYNGTKFDIPTLNKEFLLHRFNPPSPYKQIDTKLVAKRYFKFDSNKLDDLGDYLKIGRKMNTGGFGLWKGCMKGDKKSWRIMKDYNKQDVILLEKVYLAMLPYMDNHPNLALMQDKKIACPNCGSDNIVSGGFRISRVCKYRRWKCNDCGSWHQSPLEDNSQVR